MGNAEAGSKLLGGDLDAVVPFAELPEIPTTSLRQPPVIASQSFPAKPNGGPAMKSFRKILFVAALFFLFVPLVTAGAGAATTFRAALSGKNQSPPIDTPVHGTATFTLSKTGRSLSYRLYVADINDVSMAHIHIGPAGQEGPVAVWLYPTHPPAQVKKGKFTGVLATGSITAGRLEGPLKGKTIADLVQEIKNGDAYVNVHTTAHPAGEIRGQIE
jgi:hypothetical protein